MKGNNHLVPCRQCLARRRWSRGCRCSLIHHHRTVPPQTPSSVHRPLTHVLASIPCLSCTSVFSLTLWPINELRLRPSQSSCRGPLLDSGGLPWLLAGVWVGVFLLHEHTNTPQSPRSLSGTQISHHVFQLWKPLPT